MTLANILLLKVSNRTLGITFSLEKSLWNSCYLSKNSLLILTVSFKKKRNHTSDELEQEVQLEDVGPRQASHDESHSFVFNRQVLGKRKCMNIKLN